MDNIGLLYILITAQHGYKHDIYPNHDAFNICIVFWPGYYEPVRLISWFEIWINTQNSDYIAWPGNVTNVLQSVITN
jgi:hypothetical protein